MSFKTALHASIRRLPKFITTVPEKKKLNNIKKTDIKFFLPGFFYFLKLLREKNLNMHPKFELSVVAIIKNERPYLEEWINYYLTLGVQHFYIYDNESTDNPSSVLQQFNDRITYIKFPGKQRQLDSYNDALTRFGRLSKYMAFIDADEYIYLVDDSNDLLTLLNKYFSKKEVGGLAINWQIFGSSHLEKKPVGLVTDNFVYRAEKNFKKNHHIKSIVLTQRTAGFINNPHSAFYLPGCHAVDERGKEIDGPLSENVNTDIIRINHYFTKSKEEFLMKKARGRATISSHRTMQDFVDHDQNKVFDDSMRKYNKKHNLK
ncbi:glycosyltransferase family 2 protein [Liquorilactobacillus sicerae]|uniref:glycosyltransferase family 2 protein n=1 Tax=Liquorilactobacillus sicerae TaxID=1416943 RepID=UPI00247FA66A|nr:glycosyltransferase family 2 protein [Liquorilactobacillus sicerae]